MEHSVTLKRPVEVDDNLDDGIIAVMHEVRVVG